MGGSLGLGGLWHSIDMIFMAHLEAEMEGLASGTLSFEEISMVYELGYLYLSPRYFSREIYDFNTLCSIRMYRG